MNPEQIADEILARLNLPSILQAGVRAALLEAVRLGREEVEVNLKRLMMDFGNKLVTEKGFDPSGPMPPNLRQALKEDHSTEPLTAMATWLNEHPEAVNTLKEMGVNWPT